MILQEFKKLMLSKTKNRKELPTDINLEYRIHTALKNVATDSIPLRLVVNTSENNNIFRRVDEFTYIRYPNKPTKDSQEIDMDEYLLDAVAHYAMASIETERGSVHMAMYHDIIAKHATRLQEAYLSDTTNESSWNDASDRFA